MDFSLPRLGRFVTLLDRDEPRPGTPCPKIEAVYGVLTFPDPWPDRPYIISNFVTSFDGKITYGTPDLIEATNISQSITDYYLMRILRALADAVAVGRRTLEGGDPLVLTLDDPDLYAYREGVLGRPREPMNIVFSHTAALDLDQPMFTREDLRTVIVTTDKGARALKKRAGRRKVRVHACGRDVIDVGAAVGLLRRDYAVKLLLVEGGADTEAGFFAARLMDEVFLTQSPLVIGGRQRPTFVGGEGFGRDLTQWGDLVSVKVGDPDRDVLFVRRRFNRM